jgi:hypothetical protein
MAGVLLEKRRQRGCFLSPPKRLLDLLSDVAPGQAHVMQVALGPLGQFAPLVYALAPDVQRLADVSENARAMMIYHRFM